MPGSPVSKSLVLAACLFLAAGALPRDEEGLTELHRAAGRGDTAEVRRLLEGGADLWSLDSRMGVSVLHKAVYSGRADTVELLLKHGALIDLQSPSNGDTPLHDALYFKRGDDLSVIRTLLEHGASLSIRNRAGLLPLESARLLKDEAAERLILKRQESDRSEAGKRLMQAVRANDLAGVEVALAAPGVALEEADEQGFTPLLWAAREGYTAIVRRLLRQGADPNHRDAWMGATAGHKAAFWGRAEVMQVLVDHRLDLDARGGYNGYTALMDAVTRNHLEVASILIGAGARRDLAGHDGLTALDIAERNRNPAMVQLLRQR